MRLVRTVPTAHWMMTRYHQTSGIKQSGSGSTSKNGSCTGLKQNADKSKSGSNSESWSSSGSGSWTGSETGR